MLLMIQVKCNNYLYINQIIVIVGYVVGVYIGSVL